MSAKGDILMISPESDGGKKTADAGEVRLGRGTINRRSLLRGGLAVGALGAGLAAVSTFSAEPAYAASPQGDWEWCSLCTVLFYAGNGLGDTCCSGNPISGSNGFLLGTHAAGSTDYVLLNDTSQSGYQQDWAWCDLCAELFYRPDISISACPVLVPSLVLGDTSSAAHVAGSKTSYLVAMNTNPGGYQAGWNYCLQCRSLFHGSGQAVGHCAGDYGLADNSAGETVITYQSHIPNDTAYFVGTELRAL
jgi:hypothetical protein